MLIPVYAFLFIPARVALAGDYKRFLERTAKIQAGLMICVYCLSYAPALLSLKIPGYEGQNPRLLFFFVLVVQLSDVLQYAWGKLLGAARDRAGDQPQPHLGRLLRRRGQRHVDRHGAVVGHARSSPGRRPACRW